MTTAAAILAELRAAGATAYRRRDRVAIRPARAISADLIERVRVHKAELLEVLPPAPPGVARLHPVPATEPTWIVSSGSPGNMRLMTTTHPSEWTAAVRRAVDLVELIDDLHRRDQPGAQAHADELERVLAELRREGIVGWLTTL